MLLRMIKAIGSRALVRAAKYKRPTMNHNADFNSFDFVNTHTDLFNKLFVQSPYPSLCHWCKGAECYEYIISNHFIHNW